MNVTLDRTSGIRRRKLLFATNVDWYFDLHWRERICSPMTEGFEVTVTCSQSGKSETAPMDNMIPMTIDRSSLGFLPNIRSFGQAACILRRNKFDLVHAVTVKPNIYFGVLARLHGLPALLTVPGLGTVFSGRTVKYQFLQRIIIFFYRLAGVNSRSFFTFENSQDRDRFLSSGVCSLANSTVVAGAGIDLKKFRCPADVCPVKRGQLDLLFAARLLKGKGLENLVRAVTEVNTPDGKVTLHVAGIADTDTREAIPMARIKKWHDEGKINYLGRVKNMPALLARMHAVALPTTYGEGLPRILLEANACCRPVIATDIAGCNEFVRHNDNGLLVRPGNTDELAAAIRKLLDPALRKRMGLSGRRKVEESFAMEKVIAQYRDIYDKLTTNG